MIRTIHHLYITLGILLAAGCVLWPQSGLAFFSNEEVASAQTFAAGELAWQLPELPSTVDLALLSDPMPFLLETTAASLPAQYQVVVTQTTGPSWCGDLELVLVSPLTTTSAPLGGFASTPAASLGLHSVQFVRRPTVIDPAESGVCVTTLLVTAWQADRPSLANSFFDQFSHTINVAVSTTSADALLPEVSAPRVVLNEVYPTPLATTTEPLEREWVELFNDSADVVDIANWSLGEENSTAVETRHTISSANTCADGAKVGFARPWNGASTSIAPGGRVVIEFCAQTRLRNGGDVVRLYNAAGELQDEHAFGSTIAGKSHARIPDGGTWVDPLPTPGAVNTVTIADLVAEGWTPPEIAAVQAVVVDFAADTTSGSGEVGNTSEELLAETVAADTDDTTTLENSPESGVTEEPLGAETLDETTIIDGDEPTDPTAESPEGVSDSVETESVGGEVPESEDTVTPASDTDTPVDSDSAMSELIEPQPAIVPEDAVEPEAETEETT